MRLCRSDVRKGFAFPSTLFEDLLRLRLRIGEALASPRFKVTLWERQSLSAHQVAKPPLFE